MTTICALCIGFLLDLLVGDPQWIPHPIRFLGKLISSMENFLRKLFPKTPKGETLAGLCLWLVVVTVATCLPAGFFWLCGQVSPWVRFLAECWMCSQLLATKSLRVESMKVYDALKTGSLPKARQAVSMIVGRDTDALDAQAVTRAAVETVAENTSDGVVAPMLYMAIGGAPLGFFYKAVNTMDSMLGYTEMPYKNIGHVPAKMDDLVNFLPSRLSALLMLAAGWCLKLDVKQGWRIYRRDRYHHASPNSAQTESVCAGLLGLRLAGDAWYHGVRHRKPYIGDPCREIEYEDIPGSCRLLYVTACLSLAFCALLGLIFG